MAVLFTRTHVTRTLVGQRPELSGWVVSHASHRLMLDSPQWFHAELVRSSAPAGTRCRPGHPPGVERAVVAACRARRFSISHAESTPSS
jgi:hypothetical protein